MSNYICIYYTTLASLLRVEEFVFVYTARELIGKAIVLI